MDCVFLQSVLGGSGVRAFIETLSMGEFDGVDARLYVDRTGLERAAPIIEDFKERGPNVSLDTKSED